jgi:hypothetical protein
VIRSENIVALRIAFPQVEQGASDARAGVWREVAGDYESMAYEIGRMLALEPPVPTGGPYSLGLVQVSPYIERAIKQLVMC